MNPINKIPYLGFLISLFYNTETNCFSAVSEHMSSNNAFDKELKNFCGGYKTPTEAINDVKKQIDAFLKSSPKSYKELANMIEESLTYEQEYEGVVNPDILKMLVEAFTLNKK